MTIEYQRQHLLETYKSLIAISVEGFKYFALVNGGAIVVMLGSMTSIARLVPMESIQAAIAWFAAGAFAAGLAMVCSYLTQLRLYDESLNVFWHNATGAGKRPMPAAHRIPLWLAIILCIVSLACFACGAYQAVAHAV